MIFGIDEASRAGTLAVIDAPTGRQWNYGELAAAVASRRAELPAIGKELLFVFCRNRIESLLWYLAAFDSGHAVALLDASLNQELKSRLVDLYRPELVVSDDALNGYRQVSAGLWRICPGTELPPPHPDLSLLLPTSGTTGDPKFVRLSRRNLEANAESICQALAIGPGECAVANLPLHYSFGLSIVNTHLAAGAALMLTEDSITSEALWSAVRQHRCTSLAGVPYTYQTLRRLQLDRLNVPSILTCTQAGGRLDERHVEHFHEVMQRRGGRFFVMYGQTEASPRIAILPSGDLPARPGSVGLPVPGGSFSLSPDGELIYEGPNVMMGYALNRNDLTKGDELRGRLHTGDRACLKDGYLYIQGRTGREVKLLGLRINLDDIESMLQSHGPTAVTGGDEKLLIFCEYGDEAAYRRYALDLSARLHLNFTAFSFRHIETIPLTGNGKTDYRKLAEIAE